MKRDLSQPFDVARDFIYLIVLVPGDKYLVLSQSKGDYYDADFTWLPSITVDYDDDMPMTLVRELRALGLAFSSCEEVLRVMSASYSYADDTPGEVGMTNVLLVKADMTEHFHEGTLESGKVATLITFEELAQETKGNYPVDSPVYRAVATLQSRKEIRVQ